MLKYLVLILSLTLIGCQNAQKELLKSFNIPPQGEGVILRDYFFSSMRQITIHTKKEFPSNHVYLKYQEILSHLSFESCKSKKDNWDTYLDETVKPTIRVFNKVNYYINKKLKVFGIINVRYNSINIDDKTKPDNKKQIINIILYEVDAIEDEASRLELSC